MYLSLSLSPYLALPYSLSPTVIPFRVFYSPLSHRVAKPPPPPPPHPISTKAAKRAARQEKFGFVNPDAEKKAKSAWLAAEQAEKKAKRIARFGVDTTPTPAPKSSTPLSAKTGGGGGRGGGGGGKGGGKGRGGGGGGGRRQQGGRGGGPVSATTMLSQGLKSSR